MRYSVFDCRLYFDAVFQTVLQAVQTEDGYSLQVFGQFFSNPNQRKVIGNTVVLGVLSVFTCGVIGIMLAMYMTFLVGKWKRLFTFCS